MKFFRFTGKRLFTEPGRNQGTTREGVLHNINITAESKGLTGPALDETWSAKFNMQIIEFKAHLEQVNAHIDTEENHAYRLAHIDRAWRNRIDNNLFNLDPGAWMKLPHEEFFQELIRTFPRSYNKGHQLAWTKLTYVQEAERFIDTSVMAESHKIWTGDWQRDRSTILKLTDTYSQLTTRCPPSDDEAEPGGASQSRLVALLRSKLYSYATSSHGTDKSQGLLAFLGEVDMGIYRRGTNTSSSSLIPITEMKKPTRADDPHTQASSLPNYLKAMLLSGEHIYETIILPSAAYGILPKTDNQPAGRYGSRPNNSDRYQGKSRNPRERTQTESHYGPAGHSSSNTEKNQSERATTPNAPRTKPPKETKSAPKGDTVLCHGCGRTHEMPCVLGPQGANHPDWNSEPNVPWSESELGKQ